MKIFPKILICFFLLANCANVSNAQMSSGILKTSEGFLAVINSDSLWFTIQLDDSRFREPQFIEASRLEVISHVLYVQMLRESDISTKKEINPLISLMNWETDYIRNSENAIKKRSDFIIDSLGTKSTISGVSTNAWYYSINVDENDLYIYFLDIYKNGEFIRIEFYGNLENARTSTSNLFSQLNFYPNEIDIAKLQAALSNGKFGY
jgi:hypothetical protein